MPWTSLLLAENLEWLWGRFLVEKSSVVEKCSVAKESEIAECFSAFLNELIQAGALDVTYLSEVLRYEQKSLTNADLERCVDDYEPIIYRARPLVANGFDLGRLSSLTYFPMSESKPSNTTWKHAHRLPRSRAGPTADAQK